MERNLIHIEEDCNYLWGKIISSYCLIQTYAVNTGAGLNILQNKMEENIQQTKGTPQV